MDLVATGESAPQTSSWQGLAPVDLCKLSFYETPYMQINRRCQGCGEDRSEQVQAEIAKQIINVKRLVYYPNSPELPASVHIPLQSFPRSRLQESRPIGTQLPMARRTAAQHGTPNDQHLIHQRITVTSPNSSPTKDPRNVFFIIGSGPKPGDLHWLSQENVVNWGTANFFIWLRGEYYKRRGGIWRWLFRIRVLSHCDFFKVSRRFFAFCSSSLNQALV